MTNARKAEPKTLKERLFRPRAVYVFYVTLLALALLFISDPDNQIIQNMPFGAGFTATIILQMKAAISITLLHYTRKAMFDYIDLEDIYNLVFEQKDAVGAALFAVAVAIFVLSFAVLIAVSAF